MKFKLFVAHLPETMTEDELTALFADVGAISAIELLIDEKSGAFSGKARFVLEADKRSEQILTEANSLRLGDRRVFVSPRSPRDGRMKPTADERQLAAGIADTLGETETALRLTFERLVWFCGETFAQSALEETQQIEAEGGLWIADGSRRRTPGGVYLYLVKGWITSKMLKAVFYGMWKRRKKPKAKPTAPAAAENDRDEPAREAEEALIEPAATDKLAAARARLAELRAAHQAAQELLAAIKAGKADKSVGLFSTMQQVVSLQQQIDRLLAEHPALA